MAEPHTGAPAEARPPICDAEVRRRVTTDLGVTYLVEAGAGTGKTQRPGGSLRGLRAGPAGPRRRAPCGGHHVHGEGRRRAAPARARALRGAGGPAHRRASGARGRRGPGSPGRRAHHHHPQLRRPSAARVPGRGRDRPGLRAARPLGRGAGPGATLGRVAAHAGRRRRARGVAEEPLRDWFARLLRRACAWSDIRDVAVGPVYDERYDVDAPPAASGAARPARGAGCAARAARWAARALRRLLHRPERPGLLRRHGAGRAPGAAARAAAGRRRRSWPRCSSR